MADPVDRQEEARRNRAVMPVFSSFFDSIAAWDPGATVAWAEEGGVVLGSPPQREWPVWVITWRGLTWDVVFTDALTREQALGWALLQGYKGAQMRPDERKAA